MRPSATGCNDRHLELDAVREEDLEHYFNELRDHDRSVNTVARSMAAVRGCFAYVVEEGELSVDPERSTARGSTRANAAQAARRG